LNQEKGTPNMKLAAFDVMLHGTRITTVFKPAHLKSAQVRNQLVAELNFDGDIEVERLA
jgi:hypothetical protein